MGDLGQGWSIGGSDAQPGANATPAAVDLGNGWTVSGVQPKAAEAPAPKAPRPAPPVDPSVPQIVAEEPPARNDLLTVVPSTPQPEQGALEAAMRQIPGGSGVYDAAHELRQILYAPADGGPLKSDSRMESAVNGILRFTSGLNTPEAVATWAAGAGIASKVPELLNSPKFLAATARYPIVQKGLDIAARAAVPAYFGVQNVAGGARQLIHGWQIGSPEEMAGGAAGLVMGGGALYGAGRMTAETPGVRRALEDTARSVRENREFREAQQPSARGQSPDVEVMPAEAPAPATSGGGLEPPTVDLGEGWTVSPAAERVESHIRDREQAAISERAKPVTPGTFSEENPAGEEPRIEESGNVGRPAAAAEVDAGTTGAVDSGATGEGRAVHGAAEADPGRAPGEDTEVLIPGEDRAIRARYEVRELGDVQPSHNGQTFSANPDYARQNERDYSKAENQQRVIQNSSEERFNPRYHITDNPDATNGPILVDEDGNAIGGNSRAMILQRVYGRNGEGAAGYRALLEKKAAQFGIDPEAVRAMKQPVLVRSASNAELESLPGGSKWAIRKTNVTGTAQLSASERAAADAGQLEPELVDHIASAIEAAGPDATLNDALTGKSGTAIVNRLIAEGFFNEQERPALMDGKTGVLTQLAKDRIGKAMLGQFFRDSDQIQRTPAAIKGKLERIAAPLAKIQANPEWDLTPAIREAVDLVEYANAHGIKNLGDVVAQESMFGGKPEWNSDAITLAEWLRDRKPNDMVSAVRRYVNDREPTMFGVTTPEQAFAEHFQGVKRSAVAKFLESEEGTSKVGQRLLEGLAWGKHPNARKAGSAAFTGRLNEQDANYGVNVREWFTARRDLWGARVNQELDGLRHLVPDPIDQEALSIYRDFKSRPGELEQWLAGTHATYGEVENLKRAKENISKLQPAIERALNPTPAMLAADKVLTKIAEVSLSEGQRVGFIDHHVKPEEYVTHLLEREPEGDEGPGLADRAGRALGGKIGRNFAFNQERNFPTLLDAAANNFRPKTLNAFAAFATYGDKFATARATHLLIQQLRQSNVGIWGAKGDKGIPRDWVEIAPHAHPFRNLVGYADAEGKPQGAYQTLYVPPAIEKALRPITDPDYSNKIAGFTKLRMFQAYTKAAQLGLSYFHATSENYMALANMGARGWLKALKADRLSPEFLEQERDLIGHGGTTSIQGKTFEAHQAPPVSSLPTWAEAWRTLPGLKHVDEFARTITEFTFDKMQRQFKVTDYALHKAAWIARNPHATPAEENAALRSIAKEINAVYGGLHTENLGINKISMNVARAILLAPDWTFSNIFNVKYALEGGTPGGKLARMFWLRAMLGGMIATQMASLLLTRKVSKRPTQAYMGVDKDGKEIYQNLFFKGAAGDLANVIGNVKDYGAVVGLTKTIGNKVAPALRTGIELTRNEDFLGRKIVPKGMNPIAGTVRAGAHAARGLLPIPWALGNMKDMLFGPESAKYKVPLEVLTTLFAGTPPSHVADKPAKPQQGIWDQIMTGNPSAPSGRKRQARVK